MARFHANLGPFGVSSNNLGIGAYARFMYDGCVAAAEIAEAASRMSDAVAARRTATELQALIRFVDSLAMAHIPEVDSAALSKGKGAAVESDTVPVAQVDDDPSEPSFLVRLPGLDVMPKRMPTGSYAGDLEMTATVASARDAMYLALLGGLTVRIATAALAMGFEAAQVFASRSHRRKMELLTVATLNRLAIDRLLADEPEHPGLAVFDYADKIAGHIDENAHVVPIDVSSQPGLADVLRQPWDRISRGRGTVGAIEWK